MRIYIYIYGSFSFVVTSGWFPFESLRSENPSIGFLPKFRAKIRSRMISSSHVKPVYAKHVDFEDFEKGGGPLPRP